MAINLFCSKDQSAGISCYCGLVIPRHCWRIVKFLKSNLFQTSQLVVNICHIFWDWISSNWFCFVCILNHLHMWVRAIFSFFFFFCLDASRYRTSDSQLPDHILLLHCWFATLLRDRGLDLSVYCVQTVHEIIAAMFSSRLDRDREVMLWTNCVIFTLQWFQSEI